MAIKRLGEISVICLAAFSVLVCVFWAYYKIFNKDYTLGVNNIGDQLGIDVVKSDDLSQTEKDAFDERWFMEARYFDNTKKNGIELQELNFNYFQDWSLTSNVYRSTGMQFIGDYTHEVKKYPSKSYIDNMISDDFYYYDTTNGISWQGTKGNNGQIGTKLNRNEGMIIKIDGKPYRIKMTGSHTYQTGQFLWWKSYTTVYYTYPMLFERVFDAIKSNSKGYGDYYITLDLSTFFEIHEYDPVADKFKPDNVTNIIKNYAVLKFYYEPNGARASSQSMFGIIECNSKYDLTPIDWDTTYWQERVVYNLTEKDLFFRYSETFNGHFVSMSLDMKKMFKEMPRAKIKIVIDLDSDFFTDNEINYLGLDVDAFKDVEIDTFEIIGGVI